jgi:hypothetical protein
MKKIKIIAICMLFIGSLTQQAHAWLFDGVKNTFVSSPFVCGAVVGGTVGSAIVHAKEWKSVTADSVEPCPNSVDSENDSELVLGQLWTDYSKPISPLPRKHYHPGDSMLTRYFSFQCPEKKKCEKKNESTLSFWTKDKNGNSIQITGRMMDGVLEPSKISQKFPLSKAEKYAIIGGCAALGAGSFYLIAKAASLFANNSISS